MTELPPAAALDPVVLGLRRVFCCHRANYSRRLPENSLAAIQECVAAGAPRLEVDVRFLADDGMLIFHDAQLDRETTGRGRVSELDTAAARALRFHRDRDVGLCFLEDVVKAMRDGAAALQVDLKLMRPIGERRTGLLIEALAPLEGRVIVGSEAHWNLRPVARAGLRVAVDPSPHLHRNPARAADGALPSRQGVHGLWDDSPLAQVRNTTPRDYLAARIEDIAELVPQALEWMVDFRTICYMHELGFDLGRELRVRGLELAAWTLKDDGPEGSKALLRLLFEAGVTTVITDDPAALAAYARSLE